MQNLQHGGGPVVNPSANPTPFTTTQKTTGNVKHEIGVPLHTVGSKHANQQLNKFVDHALDRTGHSISSPPQLPGQALWEYVFNDDAGDASAFSAFARKFAEAFPEPNVSLEEKNSPLSDEQPRLSVATFPESVKLHEEEPLHNELEPLKSTATSPRSTLRISFESKERTSTTPLSPESSVLKSTQKRVTFAKSTRLDTGMMKPLKTTALKAGPTMRTEMFQHVLSSDRGVSPKYSTLAQWIKDRSRKVMDMMKITRSATDAVTRDEKDETRKVRIDDSWNREMSGILSKHIREYQGKVDGGEVGRDVAIQTHLDVVTRDEKDETQNVRKADSWNRKKSGILSKQIREYQGKVDGGEVSRDDAIQTCLEKLDRLFLDDKNYQRLQEAISKLLPDVKDGSITLKKAIANCLNELNKPTVLGRHKYDVGRYFELRGFVANSFRTREEVIAAACDGEPDERIQKLLEDRLKNSIRTREEVIEAACDGEPDERIRKLLEDRLKNSNRRATQWKPDEQLLQWKPDEQPLDCPSLKGLKCVKDEVGTGGEATVSIVANAEGKRLAVKVPSHPKETFVFECDLQRQIFNQMEGVWHPNLLKTYAPIEASSDLLKAVLPEKVFAEKVLSKIALPKPDLPKPVFAETDLPKTVLKNTVFAETDLPKAVLPMEEIVGKDGHDAIIALHAALRKGQISGPQFFGALHFINRRLLSVSEYLHKCGIAYNDWKPENIIIDETGEPIVVDFGATHLLGKTFRAFTADFSAPEQMSSERIRRRLLLSQDEKEIKALYPKVNGRGTEKSDIFQVAGVLVNGVTGYAPFESEPEVVHYEKATVEQLYRIEKPAKEDRTFAAYPRAVTNQWISRPQKLPAYGRADTAYTRFLSEAMALNPNERPTAFEAQMHELATDAALTDAEARAVLRKVLGMDETDNLTEVEPSNADVVKARREYHFRLKQLNDVVVEVRREYHAMLKELDNVLRKKDQQKPSLGNMVGSMKALVDMRTRFDEWRTRFDESSTRFDELKKCIDELKKRIDELKKRIDKFNDTANTEPPDLSSLELKERFANVQDPEQPEPPYLSLLDSLKTVLPARVGNIDEKIQELAEGIDKKIQKLQGSSGRNWIQAAERKVSNLRHKYVDTNPVPGENSIGVKKSTLLRAGSIVAKIQSDYDAIVKKFDNLRRKEKSVILGLADMTGKATTVADLYTRCEKLKARIAKEEGKEQSLPSYLASLEAVWQARAGKINQEIQKLQESMSEELIEDAESAVSHLRFSHGS